MSFGRSERERLAYEALHYPGTDVLINKLNLRDRQTLEAAERELVAHRMEQGLPAAAQRFDIAGLQELHRHMFQDVYDWAGTFRTYTTGRGAAPFATPENIGPWLEHQFAALAEERFLGGLSATRFAARAAHYVNEINAAHPFVEGNGRAQRVWLRNLAVQAGHEIVLRSSDRERWYEASRLGFEKADPEPMERLLRTAMDRARSRERGTERER
ncbi:MAG: Fic/DOC family protein [Alphaproteobacteria bacterium]